MPAEPPLEHPESSDALSPAKTWRILFVDCEANLVRLSEASRHAGYVVIGASEVAEAWSFLEGLDHVDVIVCAAHLRHESMLDFLQGIRASKHADVAVAILSLDPSVMASRLDRSTRDASLLIGADAYVVMPTFDPVELIEQLRLLRPDIPRLEQDQSRAAEHQKATERRRVAE
jgi:DNA-binding response OmpR family regulator